jgi:RIO kinase 1
VATLTTKELFDFAVDPTITDQNLDVALDTLMTAAASRPVVRTAEEEVAEKVWSQAFIPRKLEEVTHYERDHQRLQSGGDTEGIYYQRIAGMKSDMSGAAKANFESQDDDDDDSDDSDDSASSSDEVDSSLSDSEDSSEDADDKINLNRSKMTKDQLKEWRKENKKAVKEANAERRKTKIPKHIKRKATKGSKKKR